MKRMNFRVALMRSKFLYFYSVVTDLFHSEKYVTRLQNRYCLFTNRESP
jgi:hypothetical protein